MPTTVVKIGPGVKYDQYIGRAGRGNDGYFGNEHPIGYCSQCKCTHDRQGCVDAYKKSFYQRLSVDAEFKKRILALKGKVLACFCHPESCHGHVIAEYLNRS